MFSNIDTKHSRSSIILYWISILLKKNNYPWSPAASWRRNRMMHHPTTTISAVERLCITDIRDVTSTKTRGPHLPKQRQPPPSRASSSTRFLKPITSVGRHTLLNKHAAYWVFEGFFVSQLIYLYIYTYKMPLRPCSSCENNDVS